MLLKPHISLLDISYTLYSCLGNDLKIRKMNLKVEMLLFDQEVLTKNQLT